jgi:OOP family OmpA-OmpF porin
LKHSSTLLRGGLRSWLALPALGFCAVTLLAVTPNTRSFTAGEKTHVDGVIVSRQGNVLKLRGDDDAISTVDLTDQTRIELKHGMFGWGKKAMDENSLLPGLRVTVDGKGNQQGDLVASKVVFNPNSLAATRQIDTRVAPIEAKEGELENRTNSLAHRTDELANQQDQLASQEKQTEQQVGQVQQQASEAKTSADQANQGVGQANHRISDLDNYVPKDKVDVYFRINSATLSAQAKQELDKIAQETQNQKGYVLQVEGFADRTGPASVNQRLSQERADAVVRYLEQEGNVPIYRILTPAGMGTTHPQATNRESRRVEVTLLINQGVTGGAETSENGTNANQPPAPNSSSNSPSHSIQ